MSLSGRIREHITEFETAAVDPFAPKEYEFEDRAGSHVLGTYTYDLVVETGSTGWVSAINDLSNWDENSKSPEDVIRIKLNGTYEELPKTPDDDKLVSDVYRDLLTLQPAQARRVAALLIACAEDIESQATTYDQAAKVKFFSGPEVKLPNEVMRTLRSIEHSVSKPERDQQNGIKRVQEVWLAESEWCHSQRGDYGLSNREISDQSLRKFGYVIKPEQVQLRISSYQALLDEATND